MRIGHILRAWRAKDGHNVRQAAQMIGISAATLSRVERGKTVDGLILWRLIVFLFEPDHWPMHLPPLVRRTQSG